MLYEVFSFGRSVRRGIAGGFVAAAVVAAAAGPVDAGTVTFHTQGRIFDFDGIERSERLTAPENEPFNRTVTENYDEDRITGTTTATLNSTVGQDGITFRGSVSYDVRNDRFGENGEELSVSGPEITLLGVFEFSVDAPFNYELRGDVDVLKSDPGALVDTPSEFGPYDGSPTGVLEPGVNYRFVTPFAVDSFNVASGTERSFSGEFDYTLLLSPVDTGGGNGGGGEPNPIPLPPAAWSGLVVLGGVALNRLRRRRAA